MNALLLLSIAVVATCGLVYELVAAALASHLLGDSVLQFSTVIGAYLFSMGLGSYASRWVKRGVLTAFVQVQYATGLVGGSSAMLLYIVFGYGDGFYLALYLLVMLVGALVGMAVPLLMRLLREYYSVRDLVSQVLALDYLGALVASLLFPLFLLPQIGLVRTGLVFGVLNVSIALVLSVTLDRGGRWRGTQLEGVFLLLMLGAGFAFANRLTTLVEERLFDENILLTHQSPYQRLLITQVPGDVRLYLNNNLQFSSRDEYRYHEALVLPALRCVKDPKRVLVLGGGDGFAVELLLKDPRVEEITLVDLDPSITELFSKHPRLSELNGGALRSPKVTVVNEDAFVWLDQAQGTYDLAITDFPDPSNYSVGKLYTKLFYTKLQSRLGGEGVMTIQSGSPMFARRTFWSIVTTLEEMELEVRPYHAFVPSFGEWGFCLAGRSLPKEYAATPFAVRYLDDQTLASLFHFPVDMQRLDVVSNRIFDQQVVRYFRLDWSEVH